MVLNGFFERYLPVLVGLTVGAITHFAGPVYEKRFPQWYQVLGYLMRLSFIGFLSIVFIDHSGIENNEIKILVTSIFSIAAQEIVDYIRTRGWKFVVQATHPNARIDDDEAR